MIKAVFFDLYNTLARFEPPREQTQMRAARQCGLTYGQLISGLRIAKVEVDRKILAELVVNEFETFGKLAQAAKSASGVSAG